MGILGRGVTAPEQERLEVERKRWSDFSPAARTAIVLGAFAEFVVTTIALRDLIRRPAEEVRGPKLLWVPLLFVQPIGSPLYLVVGRRRRPA
jgi:Phospholipase_D-nuclease N-terminal